MDYPISKAPLTIMLTIMAMEVSCAGAEPQSDAQAPKASIGRAATSGEPAATPVAVVASSASKDPLVPPAPASQRDAVVMRAGDRVLEITFEPGPTGFVSAIEDGDVALVVPRPKSKGAIGRGDDLVLVDHVERDGRGYALFAASTHGSPECGSYGFWALRLDSKGLRVTPMIEGCFLSVGDGHPKITWSDPALLVLESPHYQAGASIEVFALDEQSFAFRSRVRAKVPD